MLYRGRNPQVSAVARKNCVLPGRNLKPDQANKKAPSRWKSATPVYLLEKWWWVANLTWFPLTFTSRVAGPAVTSGPDLRFSQGVLEMGLGWSCGPRRPTRCPHVPGPGGGSGVGREGGHPLTPTWKPPLKNTDLVEAPYLPSREQVKITQWSSHYGLCRVYVSNEKDGGGTSLEKGRGVRRSLEMQNTL